MKLKVGYLPELDLKGEAFGQISGKCQSDLKGEIEKGQAEPLFLTAIKEKIERGELIGARLISQYCETW